MWAMRAVNVSFGGIAVRVSYNIISYSASTTILVDYACA